MKIEVLYPEFCNLNADMGNIKYLKKCLPAAEIIETSINEEPAFILKDDISLVYMGTLSERAQEIVIEKLNLSYVLFFLVVYLPLSSVHMSPNILAQQLSLV